MSDNCDPGKLRRSGESAFAIGKLGEACYCYRQALRCHQRSRDTLAQGYCLRRLGQILLAKSQSVRNFGPTHRTRNSNDYRKLASLAAEMFEAAAARYQSLNDDVGIADCVVGSAAVALEQSHSEDARRLYKQSLDVFEKHRYESKQADCLTGLADVSRRQSCSEEAYWIYQEAIARYMRVGVYEGPGYCHLASGDILLERQRLGEANHHYQDAMRFFIYTKSMLGRMNALHALGDMALLFEFFDRAAANYLGALDGALLCQLPYTVGLLNFKVACCQEHGADRLRYFKRAEQAWQSIGREDLIGQWLND